MRSEGATPNRTFEIVDTHVAASRTPRGRALVWQLRDGRRQNGEYEALRNRSAATPLAFLRFLRKIEKQTDSELQLHFILDNYATHKHQKVQAWLAKHPRVHFHFIPTSSSWLNLVERLFAELTERQIKRLAVTSVAQSEAAIEDYLEKRNRNPRPFTWTATVDDIIAKVQRGNDTLATLH